MRHSRGFTLTELAIVMVIAGVLAGICIPGLISWKTRADLRGAIYTLRCDMQMARSRAIRENTRVVMVFAENGYDVFMDNGAGGGKASDYKRNGAEEYLTRRRLNGQKIDLNGTVFGSAGKKTRFNGKGIPLAGRVAMGHGMMKQRIVVSILGRMRFEQSRDGGY
jgi:prepilin-type N-terminal cleavage/methylation domain-containing protein